MMGHDEDVAGRRSDVAHQPTRVIGAAGTTHHEMIPLRFVPGVLLALAMGCEKPEPHPSWRSAPPAAVLIGS